MYKKILSIFIISFSIFSTFSMAEWNCDKFSSSGIILSGWDEKNIKEIFPKDAIEKAFENLWKYCNYNKNDNSFFPKSDSLFDQVLDVYLRRLDAKTWTNNSDDLTYWISLDEEWKQWRSFITEKWNSINWNIPYIIQNEYEKHRKSTQILDDWNLKENWYAEWKSKIEQAIDKISERSLYDKYALACDISMYISDIKIDDISYSKCKEMTRNRINAEYEYTKSILLNESNIILTNNMWNYMNKYFVQDKLSNLQQMIFDISTLFWEVNKGVAKLTPQCS